MGRDRTVTDKSGRTHDAHGKPYGKLQKRFNDAEETVAEVVLGKCTLLCGDADCSHGCRDRPPQDPPRGHAGEPE